MRKHIEKIKKKPEHEIKKISIILAIITTGIIVIIWIIILSVTSGNGINMKDEKIFDSLVNDINNINNDFVNIKDKLSDIKIIDSDNIKK